MGYVLRYTDDMTKCGQDLLSLLCGRSASVVSYSHTDLLSILRGETQIKTAQDTLADNKWKRSVNNSIAKRQQEAAETNRLANYRKGLMTGNKDYDNLPDRVAARDAKEKEYHLNRLAAQSPGSRIKTQQEIAKEVDQKGVSNWSDSRAGKFIGNKLGTIVNYCGNKAGKAVGYLMTPSGTKWNDWSKQYDKDHGNGIGDNAMLSDADRGKDVINNFQIQFNNAKKGIGSIAYGVVQGADRLFGGNSTEAQLRRLKRKNSWQNEQAIINETDKRLINRFKDDTLKTDNWIGAANYVANATQGEIGGGTLATAGIGGAANGISTGIRAGTLSLGVRAGKGTASALNSLSNAAHFGSVGSKIADKTGRLVTKTVFGAGNTVNAPFRAVGTMANPIKGLNTAGNRVLRPAMSAVGHAAKGGYNTAKAALRPGADLMKALRHPVANTRSAMQYAAQHPFRAVGNSAMYGARYLGNVGQQAAKGIYHTGKPLVKFTFSRPMWYGSTSNGMYSGALSGDYRGAANSMLEGSLGNSALGLGYMGLQGYNAMSGGYGDGEYE